MRIFVFGLLLLFSGNAVAQEMVGKPPEEARPLSSTEENPEEVVPQANELDELGQVPPPRRSLAEGESQPQESPARKLLLAARKAAEKGEYDVALEHLAALFSEYPDDPAAVKGAELRAWIENEQQVQRRTMRRRHGRTELIVGQVAHGLAAGVESVWPLEYVPFAVYPAVPMGAALLGGTLAFVATPDGIEPGNAAAINLGTLAGGVLTWTALMTNYDISEAARLHLTPVGHLLGTGAGFLLYSMFEPTAGQVSMVLSGGVWGTLISNGVYAVVRGREYPPRPRVLAGLHFLSATGGLAAGALIAALEPMPRGRVRLIDLGGVVGAVGGLIIFGAIAGGASLDGTPAQVWGAGTIGGIVGLGLTAAWTEGYRGRNALLDTDLNIGVSPSADGAPTLTVGGSF